MGTIKEINELMWDLETDNTRMTLGILHNRPAIFSLSNQAKGWDWTSSPSQVPLLEKVEINNIEYPLDWVYQDSLVNSTNGKKVILKFTCEFPNIELKSIWWARLGSGAIEHWMTIENKTEQDIIICNQDSLYVSLVSDNDVKIWWIGKGGCNASETGGVFSRVSQKGLNELILCGPTDVCGTYVPFMMLDADGNHGLYIGWEYSSSGYVEATGLSSREVKLSLGLRRDFKTKISSGVIFDVPPAFIGCYEGSDNDGSINIREFVQQKLLPVIDDPCFPFFGYNSFYANEGTNGNTTEDIFTEAAYTIKKLGFESIFLDACWYSVVGDWRADMSKFPRGLHVLSNIAHSQRLLYGLWCAWNMAGTSENEGALSVRGPYSNADWLTSTVDLNWQTDPWGGVQGCLAIDEFKEWCKLKLEWLISNYKMDILKHDGSIMTYSCDKDHHNHLNFNESVEGDVNYWQCKNYYEIYDWLKEKHPNLLLENCSGGGQIKDFGVIKRTHFICSTDDIFHIHSARMTFYDTSFILPPSMIMTYLVTEPNNMSSDSYSLRYQIRSIMMGIPMFAPQKNPVNFSQDDKNEIASNVAIYKARIRPLIKYGQLYRILPRPDGIGWDGMEYFDSYKKNGLVFLFKGSTTESTNKIKLKGLESSHSYTLTFQDCSNPVITKSGAELMNDGINVILDGVFLSELIWIEGNFGC